ncbi:MAG: hypothetical protein K1X92_16120 [Bacteroidia bacterium]|nr:hypothetical protein [Bacteroidia bacterium]
MNTLKLIIPLFFTLMSFTCQAQGTGWKFHSEKEGIKLYTKPSTADGTLQIRLTGSTTAPITSVMKTYQDVNTVKERVVNSKSLKVLKKVSDFDVYYHLISDFTWPLSDRDAIMHQVITQYPVTKVIRVDAYAEPNYLAEDKNYVRIHKWETHSISTPKPNGTVEIDYWTFYNPKGSIPTSIVESFVEDGTFAGMKKLIELTRSAKYQ